MCSPGPQLLAAYLSQVPYLPGPEACASAALALDEPGFSHCQPQGGFETLVFYSFSAGVLTILRLFRHFFCLLLSFTLGLGFFWALLTSQLQILFKWSFSKSKQVLSALYVVRLWSCIVCVVKKLEGNESP